MFVKLENGLSVRKKEIIGIFNMDTSTVSPVTRDYIKQANSERKIIYASKRVPESFILADNGFFENVYMTSFSVDTVLNRTSK